MIQLLDFEKPIAELERELEKLLAKSSSQNIDLSEQVATMEIKLVETLRRITR
jgi:acetyl-CoA carboxylase carboxyl transferase subunit alpha